MTTIEPAITRAATTTVAPAPASSGISRAIADTWTVAWRNLTGMRRVPQVLVFSTVQPVIFILMFRYVFGSAILPSAEYARFPYVDYLMPGIFVQTIAFGSIQTGVGLAEDLGKGLIERFRSLPMARSAVLAGRTTADLVRGTFVLVLMLLVGYLVQFRVQTNFAGLVMAFLVLLAFAFSLSWVFATVGLAVGNAEAAQAAAFPIMAPLVFASSAFVPLSRQPGWLQVFSAHQPVTITVNAVRALCLGGPTLHPTIEAFAWAAGIVAVFAPLAVSRYRKVA
jgi:ABC-2 type transport system permease protein/oleandomycin transport system permease protein